MTTCNIGVAPETKYGDTRDLFAPAVAYCFTHQCRVSDGGCDRARIAELEAAMQRAADIIDRNWSHQREKLPDASAILRQALEK